MYLLKIWRGPTEEVPQPFRKSQLTNTAFKQCCVPVVSKVARAPEEIGGRFSTYDTSGVASVSL